MSTVDLLKIKKLYQEKRYSDAVFEIELTTTENNRSSFLHNLLGVCRASQKGKTDRDIQYALNDFQTAFYKDNLGQISLDALLGHITLCAEMGRKENALVNNFLISEKMYLEAKKKYSKNFKYLNHGIDLYKYLLKHEKKISNLLEIINIIGLNKIFGTLLTTTQMYLNNWGQKDFEEFQKKFSKIFNVYEAKKISKIDINEGKIRVGFLSPDFHKAHSITYFIKRLLKDLKQSKFETYGLSLIKESQHDDSTDKLIPLFDNWIVLGEKTDQETINIIQDSKIDILIDLVGLWSANRISIFSTRICPLQISWLGYNNSSGLKEVDFILADVNTVKEEEKYYGSKIYKLPKIWNSHCGFDYKRTYNELPFKKNNYFTFGSFNNFMKVNDDVLSTWIKILKKTKNSKLILKSSLFVCEEVIKKRFEEEGLINSIQFEKKTKRNDFLTHFNLYDKVDLCLDTFPFNGVTTTFEALWKNVPVITKAGFNFNSRCGESILKNANIANFIALNNEDYINKAVYYANNIDKLEDVRKELFEEIEKSSIFDTTGFSSAFCKALNDMILDVNKNYR